MADWDPFADPAEAGEEEAVPPRHKGAEAAADGVVADLDLLQPWELEQMDPAALQRARELQAAGQAQQPTKARRPLCIPSVAELERDLLEPGKAALAAIPATLSPAKPPPRLTKEAALALMDALVAAYWTEDFQRRLHEAWAAASGDPGRQAKASEEACLPLQVPVIAQSGFEASRRGVSQSNAALAAWCHEPDVAERSGALAWLVNPSLQAGIAAPSGRRLRLSSELVEKALAGDAAAVCRLLSEGADPNTILLKEERLKGSDGCCQCTITSEEYTPLIAACMGHHHEAFAHVMEHPATDLDVVCCGINQEFGPYKHYTVLDMARWVKSQLVSELEGRGAKSAKDLPEPPYPRPEAEGTPEPGRRIPAPELAPIGSARQEAALPAADQSSPAVEKVTQDLIAMMAEHRHEPAEERTRLFRQLMLEWHPDKRGREEEELATAVCQWLNGPARCFLTLAVAAL